MKFNNTNQPLVTVAMVTYNSAQFVGVAIESVLASTYQNFELVISDDCSTDDTWEIIKEYKDPRIRASKNETNLREYPNRNKCIELAKGEYFIFIDGDDYIYPHGLEHFIKGAQLDSNAGMVISRPDSDHMIYPVVLTPLQSLKYDYLGCSVTSQGFPSTLFKTDYMKKHYLPTKYISGDTYFKQKLAYLYPTILIHYGLAWWRKTPGQASERLFKSIDGILEGYNTKLFFLQKYKNSFSRNELKQATKRISKPLVVRFLKSILLLQITNATAIAKTILHNNVSLNSLFYKHQFNFKISSPSDPAHFHYDK